MALIDALIGPQNFELVRERIGLILKTELEVQATNYGNYAADDVEVYVERFVKPQVSEIAIVNVTLATGDFNGQTAIQADGTITYHIDFYHKAATEGEEAAEQADYLAMVNLQRLMGICRAILEDARYITLNYARPFIMRRTVRSMAIATPNSVDMQSHVMGRLVLEVKMPETTSYATPQDLEGIDTSWKLFETELGYKFVINED